MTPSEKAAHCLGDVLEDLVMGHGRRARGEEVMASKQFSEPYNRGYDDAELGLPLEGNPYLNETQRRDYRNGYEAAKLAEKAPQ